MEQEGGGRGGAGGDGGDKNQPQETTQRGEAAQVEVQAEVQPEPQAPPRLPQQPVQCPRCDSLNTQFCYYNNYSMSQPRYFCKTCRRYWTHGGTLRNVPVGGGCRKGKRGACAKNSPSSSSENSASSSRSNRQQPLPQPQPPSQDQLLVVQAQPPNLTPMVGARDPPPSLGAVPSVTPFFQGGLGGYLSSLGVGGIHHSLSLNPSHPFDQALMNAVGVGGSNLDVVSGFNGANSPGPLRFSQYVQLGGGERDVGPLYPPAEQQSLIPSTMAANSSAAAAAAVATHRDWTHRFITNAANNIRATDGSMWSTVSTTNVSGNSQRNVAAATGSSSSASALMMPNQWPNVPGFGPPPSSF